MSHPYLIPGSDSEAVGCRQRRSPEAVGRRRRRSPEAVSPSRSSSQ